MRKRLRSHEGANAVELALVLPVLVLLLFGAITFGLAFNTKQQMEHANREAVRFAATYGGAPDATWFEAIVQRIQDTAAGQVPLDDPSLDVCISRGTHGGTADRFDGSGGSGLGSPSAFVAAGSISSGTTHCNEDGISTGATVQVWISRGARLDAVFFSQDVTLTTDGVARFEMAP